MKKAKILHNPGAGEGDITKKDLISLVEEQDFACSYSSTKSDNWEKIEPDELDFLVLAGGDGTVRKIAGELLTRKVLEKKLPIGLLPLGTANNIAKTLGLNGNAMGIIKSWKDQNLQKFDVGTIDGLSKSKFFLESVGFGVFPKLICEMRKKKEEEEEDPAERIRAALETLHELILTADVKKCKITIDDQDYSGKFLLVEVMNTRSIGPNLHLAPDADPGDGVFEVVLITEDQRKEFARYVRDKIKGREEPSQFHILSGKNIKILWKGKHVHVDDEYYKLDEHEEITVEVREGLLEFLTAPKGSTV